MTHSYLLSTGNIDQVKDDDGIREEEDENDGIQEGRHPPEPDGRHLRRGKACLHCVRRLRVRGVRPARGAYCHVGKQYGDG